MVPFCYITELTTDLSSWFADVGTDSLDYAFPWDMGSVHWVWHVDLGDMFGILPTIRFWSGLVLYGALLLWGFLEARRWFESGAGA